MTKLRFLLTWLLIAHTAGVLAADESTPSLAGEAPLGTEGVVFVRYRTNALTARPVEENTPLWVRVVGSTPDGANSLYEVRYQGLHAGQFDLRDYLVSADGKASDVLAPLNVNIRSTLPLDHNGALAELGLPARSKAWPYRNIIAGLLITWAAITVVLGIRRLLSRTKQRTAVPALAESPDDPLPRLAELALANKLSPAGKARLEMLLIEYWRDRLDSDGIEKTPARLHTGDIEQANVSEMSQLLERLRSHEEAGPLLIALESWLHERPNSQQAKSADFLQPYLTNASSSSASHSQNKVYGASSCQPD
jgi:hypothetical protein